MDFKDLFSQQSAEYSRFRPTYPTALFSYLATLPAAQNRAWDCGTGNGQAAIKLAPHFETVVATDPSPSQLKAAAPHAGVQYHAATAEASKLEAHTIDLTTVAQALHWFKHPLFFEEVRRVSKTKGSVLAVWTYELCRITPEVDTVVLDYYRNVVGKYWEPERKLVETGYKTIVVPFDELAAPDFPMTAEWTFPQLLGYLGTWSATQAATRALGRNPLESLAPRLQQAWGADMSARPVVWDLGVRIFRVS